MDAGSISEQRMRTLIDAGMELSSERDLDAVLQRIVEVSADITGARYGALGVLSPSVERIERFLTVGITDEQREAIGDPPKGLGVLGVLIHDARVLRLDDLAGHPSSSGFPPHHPAMTSFLGTPIKSGGRVFGNLYLTEKAGGFDEEDEHTIMVLAAQAGVAIENARLFEEIQEARQDLRRLAVMEDRERIARDIHDGAIQALFAVGMSLQGTANGSDDLPTKERLEAAVQELDRVIRDLRNYIFDLRPGILVDRRLDEALRDLAAAFQERTGVVTVVEIETELASAFADREGDLVQIAGEALSNVGRHADATTCRLTFHRDGETALLAIDDDGTGFDVDAARTDSASGHGVGNIHDRAERLGGTAEITSSDPEGTLVSVRIPV